MSFKLLHTLVSESVKATKHTSDGYQFFRINQSGEFPVLFPGRLTRHAFATFNVMLREPDDLPPERGRRPLHGGIKSIKKIIPLALRIFTPDGREFTNTEITLTDLLKHRDLRGSPSGPWSYTLTGEGERIYIVEDLSIANAKGTLKLRVRETVPSASAPPLINNAPITQRRLSFKFDLFRVGRFVAEISQLQTGTQWRGSMRLLNPDGVMRVRSRIATLSYPVDLRRLRKSRDARGRVRKWTLELSPTRGVNVGGLRITATVIGKGRVRIAPLKDRIDKLLGPHGQFIKIWGENKGGDALARLKITDVTSAETIDMHGLLDGALEGGGDIQAHTVYTLARKSEKAAYDLLKLEVKTLRIRSIDYAISPGVMLGTSVPSVRLTVAVSGKAKLKVRVPGPNPTLATGEVRGGKFKMEVGIKLGPDGTPQIVTEVPDSPFDIDISDIAKAALLAMLGPLGLIGGMTVAEYAEHVINKKIVEGARNLFSEPTIAPRILMTIFGAHLSYLPFRIEGDEIILDHIAAIEPDPRPTPGYYGAIGRSRGPTENTFIPPTLGNTWRANNLRRKIDHIVVVMMENRSYDHVLGYRAQEPFGDGADGLTDGMDGMIEAIEAAEDGPFDVRKLRDAGFDKNVLKLMTRLPKHVGHNICDVAEQLSVRTTGPSGRSINSPKGFVDNFKPRLGSDPQGVVPNDVLGFYDNEDLPMYAYLAENYAYCDRYYSSHPGPTLPNRMYSLVGDVQYDRYGFPILDNNNSDNFLVSRAATIYDFLTRKGLGFRVYESFPSVTMLRMFARYATDTTNIVPFDRLASDVRRGDLPPFTAIEPAMHHHPQDDDHPAADMHRGQLFVKRVYDTLSSNPSLWEKTLLIITYDEHGGFYDHVVPPLADLLQKPRRPVHRHNFGGRVIGSASLFGQPLPVGLWPTRTGSRLVGGGAAQQQIPYGVRVPTFVVSPWAMPGKGPSLTLDQCSILKTVLARFWGGEKPFLSNRVNASHSFDAFLTGTVPRMDVPPSPSLPPLPIDVRRLGRRRRKSRIITKHLSRKEMRAGPVLYHDLMGRWARQLGR